MGEAREAGYSCEQAREAGYSCTQAREAGYLHSCKEAAQAGFKCSEAKKAGFSASESANCCPYPSTDWHPQWSPIGRGGYGRTISRVRRVLFGKMEVGSSDA